ncbi:MAG: Uma2 family endonuclease, partial [Myxococcota bacterium]
GEIINGELYTQPRPAGPHTIVASELGADLVSMFGRGRGGPGGWLIVFEPQLHFDDARILVPDVAGWRVERIPMEERRQAFFQTAPDWVCEVLSPSTATKDRQEKAPVYLEAGVGFLWYVEPLIGHVHGHRRTDDGWLSLGTWSDGASRIPPFDAVALDLTAIWATIGGPDREG